MPTRVNALIANIREELDELERIMRVRSLCSNREAAEILQCTPATICNYLKQGKLHKEKQGAQTGIPLESILAMLKKI